MRWVVFYLAKVAVATCESVPVTLIWMLMVQYWDSELIYNGRPPKGHRYACLCFRCSFDGSLQRSIYNWKQGHRPSNSRCDKFDTSAWAYWMVSILVDSVWSYTVEHWCFVPNRKLRLHGCLSGFTGIGRSKQYFSTICLESFCDIHMLKIWVQIYFMGNIYPTLNKISVYFVPERCTITKYRWHLIWISWPIMAFILSGFWSTVIWIYEPFLFRTLLLSCCLSYYAYHFRLQFWQSIRPAYL